MAKIESFSLVALNIIARSKTWIIMDFRLYWARSENGNTITQCNRAIGVREKSD